MRTQVGIIGAGPAGLLLAQLLHRQGVDSVVLERQDEAYVRSRIRAGVLEPATVEALCEAGAGERLLREGLVHHGIELRFGGRGHRIPVSRLAGGRAITVYGQQEVVADLIDLRRSVGAPLEFGAEVTAVAGTDSASPVITYRTATGEHELRCDFIAGCDGFHGVSRAAVRPGSLRTYQRDYPYAWLGVLAAVPPSAEELVYARHERGFALHSMRSPQMSRFYLQVEPGTKATDWPDERIWKELRTRLATDDGRRLDEGEIVDRSVTGMRSFVCGEMRHGRLLLAGDAAHIVPPTGAKGLNLAVADARVLARALTAHYRAGDPGPLDSYTATCLEHIWRAQDFSSWMTTLLHRQEGAAGEFDDRAQLSRLEYLCRSRAAATALAENYVGTGLLCPA
ncbi:4-hydroxybenzoate 3-monooxygenase [Streptomyces sp. CB03238]|uniref:4-hydroxybenzoate 3-monooxygenase n=1 Tax=Streptomyces sp. CB03238 TaxID=1907777 RepID=UPI000A10A295|nr:4-hydroxybenzoate 3-monooxygenase [Streptomyces sp. CB03238]ORT56532.1 4-hydroxybenzoate 3-monooxygenase [Streptomyces sp. CB03238]